jgi:deoxyribonuclease-4
MFGSHLSIAGALANALDEAERLGLDTVQVFTKNQRQWKVTPLADGACDAWLAGLDRLGWRSAVGPGTVAHDSYLINLASPDPQLWAKSVNLMREEIMRCHALDIPALVSHPGAHMGEGVDAGLRRIARAYAQLLNDTKGAGVTVCFENTAGGGTTLGRSFEELARLRELVIDAHPDAASRTAFCIDTCHALAAGYDIASHANGDGTGRKRTLAEGERLGLDLIERFDAACGLANLRVLHLNDSIGPRASHRDRHAHIGRANVARGAFAAILNHPALQRVPKILETPKGEDDRGRAWDSVNLAALKRLVRKDPIEVRPTRPRTRKTDAIAGAGPGPNR